MLTKIIALVFLAAFCYCHEEELCLRRVPCPSSDNTQHALAHGPPGKRGPQGPRGTNGEKGEKGDVGSCICQGLERVRTQLQSNKLFFGF